MNERSRICVLGGGGFLGSHLVEALLARTAHEIVAIDLSLDKIAGIGAHDRLERVVGSVTDRALLALIPTCEVVVSLTALCNPSLYNTRPLDVIDASFTHLLPLVQTCTEERRWLIHFSTSEVYGKVADETEAPAMSEEGSGLLLGPVHRERWTYACAKQLLERVIWAQGGHHGLPFTIIRPFNVIGPRMDFLDGVDGEGIPRVLACFMRALLAQTPLSIVDGGRQLRTFTFVEDFINAVVGIVGAGERCQGQILNIGNPQNEISITELARMMVRIYSKRHGGDPELPLRSVSCESFYGKGYDDTRRRMPDISRIRRLTGWEPRTTLEEMLPPIIDDYVAQYGQTLRPGQGGR